MTVNIAGSPTNTYFTITWTASSDAHAGLNRYELWRAPNQGAAPGIWAKVKDVALGTLVTTDTPPASGIWWYGVHAVDNVGNWSSESNPPGPAQGIYDTVPPVATNKNPTGNVTSVRPTLSVVVSDNLTSIGSSTITVTDTSGTVLTKNFASGTTNLTVEASDWSAPLANNTYTVNTQSSDAVGNTLNDSNWTFTIINLPPNQPEIR